MTPKPMHFTVVDPRTFEGDPFEVAERACLQAQAVARILSASIEPAHHMARNAQLSRNLQDTPNDARASEWEDSAQSRQFARLHAEAKKIERQLGQLAKAAAFDPKKAKT